MATFKSTQWEKLEREIAEIAPCCYVCQLSEEKTKCSILVDPTKCQKTICLYCLSNHQNDHCLICTHKISDHHKKKYKNTTKDKNLVDAHKLYNREFKIRTMTDALAINPILSHLLAYFSSHSHNSARKKYEDCLKQMSLHMEEKRSKVVDSVIELKCAKLKSIPTKVNINPQNEKQTLGYDTSYRKGLSLILNSLQF